MLENFIEAGFQGSPQHVRVSGSVVIEAVCVTHQRARDELCACIEEQRPQR